jgi:lipopolysaccharide export system permease protein
VIFKQALQRELSRTFTATLVVMVTIVMTMMLIRTLGLASKGSVNPQEVFLVMAYSVLGHIPTLLTLSLFVAMVTTLNRLMRDSELIIWLTSGQSLLSFIRPLFSFALPLLITIAALALVVWPWTNGQMNELRIRFEQRSDLERITPGQFQESTNGQRVFYLDKLDIANTGSTGKPSQSAALDSITQAQNIFIAAFESGRETITAARSGRIELRNGEQFLVLEKGQRLERDAAGKDIKLTQFDVLGSRIKADPLADLDNQPKAVSSWRLIQEPTAVHLGELSWRLGLLLAAINLVVLALALSSFNPRTGRGSALGAALLAFIFYYNMMNVLQSWIASGRFGFAFALAALHGSILLLASGWLWLRARSVAR